ncbi:putative DNA-binding transcriptional regulator YafY [Kineosphaera limosa]|uniref:Putative DeoR family transcriptional regulator n=1 Tax=Kineosphaera limosa NBRC 100340 TaxID=1184609 RepID=K6W7R1_9MICO|nr:WYL domain-containing protein [Kineosphaera limosa]NYE01485.1 putative DNA-binding transcriptional regulator YafY [Kineosphaera limosa]GAB95230.1 putative DeoR family transcriptional regulator [Kineosphaera limosa NBRC 100340]
MTETTDSTVRLLRLLELLQQHAVWTGPELADRLEVSVRGVRRDVARLRTLGYPVHSERGLGGGYRLAAGKAMPPLVLDDEEAVAVAVSLSLAAGGTVSGVEESAARALAKLDQVVPKRLRERIDAVRASTVRVGSGTAPVDAALLTTLARACRDRVQARFSYRAASRSQNGTGSSDVTATAGGPVAETSAAAGSAAAGSVADSGVGKGAASPEAERRVEPVRLVATGRRWYLFAYDLDREDWRVFRLDRMSQVHATTWRYQPRADTPDAIEHVSAGISRRAYRHEAVVRVHADCQQVRDQFGPTVASVEADGPDACLLRTGADDLRTVAAYLAFLPWDFEALAPPELSTALRDVADRLQAAGR